MSSFKVHYLRKLLVVLFWLFVQAKAAPTKNTTTYDYERDDPMYDVKTTGRFQFVDGDIIRKIVPRNGLRDKNYRWPKAEVPYVIEGEYSGFDRKTIKIALDEFGLKTCASFRPRTEQDKDYVAIVNDQGEGCFSDVGRIGGRQLVHLSKGFCVSRVGIPIHELMHSIGFWHEQNRYDRDTYVEVLTENILEEKLDQFDKYPISSINTFNVEYDYESIMHYPVHISSKNDQPTLKVLRPLEGKRIGELKQLSAGDIKKINSMYPCKSKSIPERKPNQEPKRKPNQKPNQKPKQNPNQKPNQKPKRKPKRNQFKNKIQIRIRLKKNQAKKIRIRFKKNQVKNQIKNQSKNNTQI